MRSRVLVGLALAVIVVMGGCGGETAEPSAGGAVAAESAAEPVEAPAAPADAASVCAQIEAAGVGRGCTRALPGGANARARMRFDFDLVSLPGEGGSVLSFETAADYDATVATYAEVAVVAGPHRYGNRGKLIFVQMNQGASLEVGDQVRALVEGL